MSLSDQQREAINKLGIQNEHNREQVRARDKLSQQYNEHSVDSQERSRAIGARPVVVLRVFSWVEIVGSLGLAWLLGSTVSSGSSLLAYIIPIGIAAQGLFLGVVFLVLASIADNVIAIRRNSDRRG